MNSNRCWGSPFSGLEIDSALKDNRLLTAELELSRVCDLRCIYCYASSGDKLPDELSYTEILDAIAQCKNLGTRKIIILGGGEPMLYPRIMDVIRHIHGQGLGIELFTNGTRITPETAAEFYSLKVEPVVKFNSLDPETQDHLAGKKNAHKNIRNGLENLLEAGYAKGDIPFGAQTIICQQNFDEIPEMWRWLRSRNIIPYFETITDQGRAKENEVLAVPSEKAGILFKELSRIDRDEFGIIWEPKPPVAAFSCKRHLYSCTITTTGEVIPCPGVDIPAGNIRTKPLAEIIAGSEVFQNLRNIRETIKGSCKSCELSSECYGCRGMAHHVNGDYLSTDPLCWRAKE
ncbi:radical SAM/SPASM domain-containing protein [Maridesulfovibrio hydrothermalis]|uniref:Radical SAM domain protein n=1 Tax=Maridesulfovibrio hydrothermalis AM13 = DSM 14728 TaxID=1121451 RepID=L0RB85_9BACT|nr:radical SAM protein [Maridesulfovibrio hydrothermalis]CCO23430.1 Radical SAM domain protein [Maridesulfovibrio hydrothermalis AM13 = DSM 14728]